MGGVLFNKSIGLVLQHVGRPSGYPLVFAVGSTFHILGFIWILLTIRNVAPLVLHEAAASQPLPLGTPEIAP